jgi:hypothetical protein
MWTTSPQDRTTAARTMNQRARPGLMDNISVYMIPEEKKKLKKFLKDSHAH